MAITVPGVSAPLTMTTPPTMISTAPMMVPDVGVSSRSSKAKRLYLHYAGVGGAFRKTTQRSTLYM